MNGLDCHSSFVPKLASNVNMTLGIDATPLTRGGGITHLIELLAHAKPLDHGFRRVVVWGSNATLAKLPDRSWLIKRNPHSLNKGLINRTFWQFFRLPSEAKTEGCNVLFSPGGSHSGRFHPVVTMSRNMLPFEWSEIKRFGFSMVTFKLLLLRFTQTMSFKNADGVIFLTKYAERKVQRVSGFLSCHVTTIPHGLNRRFRFPPKHQESIDNYSNNRPYRVLYVSIVDQYKHQWQVIEVVGMLRRTHGWPLVLDLVGASYTPALEKMNRAITLWDPKGEWISYHGSVPYNELHTLYAKADLGVFASSCENMPNILLEKMAAGLPLASSSRGPMPEVLGLGGLYFDPENKSDILEVLQRLILDPTLRKSLVEESTKIATEYSWEECSSCTFEFLSDIIRQFSKNSL